MKTITLAAGLGAALLAATAATSAGAATSCSDLTSLKLPQVTITSAVDVPASMVSGGLQSIHPAYCKVLGSAKPTEDSDIRFEVAIPTGSAWNGRYLQVGNGGFAGTIPAPLITMGVSWGYATAGTDDGHQSTIGTTPAGVKSP